MPDSPEAAWERLAALCEARGIPLTVVDRTERFQRWWEGYTERTMASTTVPDTISADPEP